MNKRIIKLVAGILLIGLLVGAYLLFSSLNKEDAAGDNTAPEAETISVYTTDKDALSAINYENEKGSTSYIRSEGKWQAADDPAFPLKQDFVDMMAETVSSITATRDITDEGGNEADYGFDAPTLTLSVTDGSGSTADFTVGMHNTAVNGYYLKYNDRIYIIDPTLVDGLNYSVYDSLPTTEFQSIASDTITAVSVNGTAAEGDRLEQLKTAYASVVRGGVVNYKDKENYGFDGSETKVEVTYTETAEVSGDSGAAASTVKTDKTYAFSFAEKDGAVYMMLPDDDMIYQATGLEPFATEITE